MEALTDLVKEHAELKRAVLKEALGYLVNHPVLDDRERKVDELLVKAGNELRAKLPTEFFSNPLKFRQEIESSELFKMLLKIPKGSLHHVHFDAFGHHSYFVKYLKAHPEKYRLDPKECKVFYYKDPAAEGLSDAAEDAKILNDEEFYAKYHEYFVMNNFDLHDAKNVWEKFDLKIWNRLAIIQIKDSYLDYLKYAFAYAFEHGFHNVQGRLFLNFAKDAEMKDIPLEEEMQIYLDAQEEVQKKYPEFLFSGVIQSLRFWSNDKMKEYLGQAYALKKKFPKLIIGFDAVAEEDNRKLSDLLEVFLEYKKAIKDDGIQHFEFLLHAGESLEVDNDNLVDAVLFGCPRIGHAYNLYRHPILFDKVKQQKICIEWSPLSNQFLRYVKDLRNHPHFGIYNTGIKFSISSDDPGVFGVDPLAWDLVSIILANKFNLQDVKGFFLNSIEYSCLDKDQHDSLRNNWFKAWHKYIDTFQ
mmetsp:Transcript_22351/g.25864  ORF Transcript_22351/g.25864 Transcript_22351/m.25864 type:complete len:471 (-) Transcript_22351:41-1453(-)|eukprot:CAMPEP_0176449464 /NCGR_PEP_ID=MMETSP0127-20121128/26483_1 /TAXON_ID=938130 /ORGANISM="Platyophrya macrostoma, Strain WH" /LENGTH=470 /DNA_ID=CAMNT_0017836787 /DNA_START=26 /DNA_END=1438 /DNA_ORIENTATION=-